MKNGFVILSNKTKISCLVALSEKEQEQGLMGIEPPTPIMAFAFSRPKVAKFWMKNTKAPLDIIYCFNSKIVDIQQGEPFSTKLIGNNILSDIVIEFPQGTVNRYNMCVGDNVIVEF